MFLSCHKDETAMETAIIIWSKAISHIGLFHNIISESDPRFHNLFGAKLSFSKSYHPQTDFLEERMIQTLEDMIRIFCAYSLQFKDSDGFKHDWCTLIPALELEYIHQYTLQLEKQKQC
ncbi:hypothetical protein O181_046356 [Austropuccinia psidii MF-1]|uniref:Uncharacterized protein n=1 Tax=Austropuccinia psidii MF-1 TaxID=1389203 RepID=A0A9Q3DLT3_9BASI|nr:hypothetical protein [Austropuccinia psidii MF-1]